VTWRSGAVLAVFALFVLAAPAAALAAPVIEVTPSSLYLGDRNVGSGAGPAETVTVANSGDAAMQIGSVVVAGADASSFPLVAPGDTCSGTSLDPGEQCTIELRFEPQRHDDLAATLSIPGDVPATVPLAGVGTLPAISLSPAAGGFANQLVGESSVFQAFHVVNTGDGLMKIDTVELGGAGKSQFRLSDLDNCSGFEFFPGEECTVKVLFAPTVTGPAAATLSISGNASGSALLTGVGVAPAFAATPASLQFATQLVGTTSDTQSATVVNSGSAPMAIGSVAIGGRDASSFVVLTDRCEGRSLAPGASCSVDVALAPTAARSLSAVLRLGGDVPGQVALAGSGTLDGPEQPAPAAIESPAPRPSRISLSNGHAALPVTRGFARLRLSCESGDGAACAAKLTLLRAPAMKKLPARLGSWAGEIAANGSREVSVKLGKAAGKALAARGRLPVVVLVEGSDGEQQRISAMLIPRG
jgi:hypothetical protein